MKQPALCVKSKFATRTQAERALPHGDRKRPVHVYHCQQCHCFHVGGSQGGNRLLNRQRRERDARRIASE